MSDEVWNRFTSPGSEYRGMPFWAWNTKMTPEHIDRMTETLKEMGMGGAYYHSRSGMDNPYLSCEFFDMIQYAHKKAKENGLLSGLYDEDRWASGFAGGYVTKDDRFRRRFLVFSPLPPERAEEAVRAFPEGVSFSGERTMLSRYRVHIQNGYLAGYERLNDSEPADANTWYCWYELMPKTSWYGYQSYVDTLNPEATKRFIELTHEQYYRELGDDFGKSIPAIFSDEPSFSTMGTLTGPDRKYAAFMPYTDGLDQSFFDTYGVCFLDIVPEIFWLSPNGRLSQNGYRFHDLVCEMLVSAYCDTIGSWCGNHHIDFTGHMFREDFLEGQTYALGEAMRCYRSFQRPGIDVLSDNRRITTAKQVASAARQFGRRRIVSEMYGVTYYTFDFRGHKLSGDWQTALGITDRVHHLAWTSMEGDAKRDYPASICFQSPWYREYKLIEDYFARINTVLTRGKALTRIGVIHPIETYWLYWGPDEQTAEKREEMDERFVNLTNWLLFALLDFDYISEGLLKDMDPQDNTPSFRVGKATYDVIVVPALETLRSTTLQRLQRFAAAGGKIIFMENKPMMVDALESSLPGQLPGPVIPYAKSALVKALEPYRYISCKNSGGVRSGNLFSQLRQDGDKRYLFLSHVNKPVNPDIPVKEKWTVTVQGKWSVEQWDAMKCERRAVPSIIKDGQTSFDQEGFVHDSWLYCLTPSEECVSSVTNQSAAHPVRVSLPDTAAFKLEESNPLVMDYFAWRTDDGPVHEPEETLAITKAALTQFGLKTDSAQPWLKPKTRPVHTVTLETGIESELDIPDAHFAMENPQDAEILFNSVHIPSTPDGWYTDPSIRTIPVHILRGINRLTVTIPVNERTKIENMFLLGSFGVEVSGQRARITHLPDMLSFSSLTLQKLPFYGGNLIMSLPFGAPTEGRYFLDCTFFRCPLITVSVDGCKKDFIAFAPYRADLGILGKGPHTLQIRLFGNRVNTFGALHCCDRALSWKGPNMWTTSGSARSREYQLCETGLLKAPELFMESR